MCDGEPLGRNDYVISADDKTSIQVRCRCHPNPTKALMIWVATTTARWPSWRISVWADFEFELVAADANVVTVSQRGAVTDSLALHLDTVGRPQIDDHETGSGVDDHGVVPADVGVVENDVVV
jgi:hypothetical protein